MAYHRYAPWNDADRARLNSTSAAAHRLDGDKADVPFVLGRAVEDFSRRRIGHELDRHAETFGERRGKLGRDADRLAVRTLLHQHRVAEIHRGAELAGGRQILEDFGGGRRLRERRSRCRDEHSKRGDNSRHGGPSRVASDRHLFCDYSCFFARID